MRFLVSTGERAPGAERSSPASHPYGGHALGCAAPDSPALVSWSSGKDSAWMLHVLRREAHYTPVGLLTTLNSTFDRVAMHSTRRELVEAQARAAGLPLIAVPLPWPCANEHYEAAMSAACEQAVAAGVKYMAFGDLFLEEIRRYREDRLAGTGLTPIFPLWGMPTGPLVREMLEAGLRARIVCVDPRQIAPPFAGRELDPTLLAELPASADPCGENGEFHTFAYAGPMFSRPISIVHGELVQRDGFCFADVLLAEEEVPAAAASGAPIPGRR